MIDTVTAMEKSYERGLARDEDSIGENLGRKDKRIENAEKLGPHLVCDGIIMTMDKMT